MIIIKKLDAFVLKKFLWIFFGSFFITLFVFMLQFTWRYTDELIGKGLTLDVLSEFFWYMGLTLVPMSLPLAILLASLISFGNMGEQLELLAMKAAGVSLLRIIRPIAILSLGLSVVSFYFQNKTSPEAQLKLRTLLLSMKQTSPALEIPEGVFYGNIPNLSLYVEHKNVATGMLYNVMIYKTDQGFDKAQIVVADSARVRTTDDRLHLIFDIWSGRQFQNLGQNGPMDMSGVGKAPQAPYDRETFCYKQFIIDFDSNFAKMDEEQLRSMATAKNLVQLSNAIDSMELVMDSIGKMNYEIAKNRYYREPALTASLSQILKHSIKSINFDSLLQHTSAAQLSTAEQLAVTTIQSYESELEWNSAETQDGDGFIRSHEIEWNRKFTYSLACIFFFLIGAPLGAIIRKGGLGFPVLISILIFIGYYVIDTSSMKMARDGKWNMIYGMWISSAILFPIGLYLTYMANKDSDILNIDLYKGYLYRLLGIRKARNLQIKEVIIDTPNYFALNRRAEILREKCELYLQRKKLYYAPGYIRVFFKSVPDHKVERIAKELEEFVDELSNTRSPAIMTLLNQIPIIFVEAHTSPFENRKWNIICGAILPVGFILWIRIWRFRLRLYRDMKKIEDVLQKMHPYIIKEITPSQSAQLFKNDKSNL